MNYDYVVSFRRSRKLHVAEHRGAMVYIPCLGSLMARHAVQEWDYRYRGAPGDPCCKPACISGFAYLDANP